ncbi:nuclear receptor ror-alpha [Plakobranchus ocellatus]|uniref:Nuclear receptor ror-alpha n=1 Tax=Plakobranchus ocellatus TaxID=259542 RepID=A0AAV4CGS1_9GAST|nr:nuclear receptor ror-alpha [Plakobranchus ocellatus]
MGRKRKVPKSEDGETNLHLPPCRVCGGPAGGFHYGVNTCEACKGFFHRSSGLHDQFKCKTGGNCSVSYTIPKFCKKCRYAKCIAVGMAKQAIKTGRYTIEKRTKDILEVKSLQEKGSFVDATCDSTTSSMDLDCKESQNVSSINIKTPDSTIHSYVSSPDSQQSEPTFQTQACLDKCCHLSCCSCHVKNNSSTSSQASLQRSPASQVSKLSPLMADCLGAPSPYAPTTAIVSPGSSCSSTSSQSIDSTKSAVSVCQLCPCSLDIYEMYRDKDSVIETLVKANHDCFEERLQGITKEEVKRRSAEHIETCHLRREMFGSMHRIPDQDYDQIYACTGLDADGRKHYFDQWIKHQELYIRALAKFAKCIPGFSLLNIQDQITLIKYSRAEFMHILGYNRVDTAKSVILCVDGTLRCKQDFGGIERCEELFAGYMHLCDRLENLELAKEEIVILSAIVLMAPDRDHSIESEKARLIYELLNDCLIHSLGKHCDRPLQKYAKIISNILWCRTLCYRGAKVLKSLRLDKYSNVRHSPLLCEMFGGIYFDDVETVEENDHKNSA